MSRTHSGASCIPRIICLALAATSVMAVPAAHAESAAELQAALDAPGADRAALETRAKTEGLEVVTIKVGPAGQDADETLVAGGGHAFRDCRVQEVCPDMVVVPSSKPDFKTGSPDDEDGHQEDETLLPASVKPFAIGRLEITVGEYKACVAEGGCAPPEWLEPGSQHNIETGTSTYYRSLGEAITRGDQPIVGVSYLDAVRYTEWLSKTSGKLYRLPTEVEWEHAARAGTTTAYWWGNDARQDGKVWMACADCGSEWDRRSLAPAAAFEPNPWGLHNANGNVWEWVADVWCEKRVTRSADAGPRTEADCPDDPGNKWRTLRGGSAFYNRTLSRAAMRVRNVPDFRNFSVGFRVARQL